MFIVTTKQGRFASALLKSLGDVDVPADSDRMYALGSGPKVDTLKLIQEMYPDRPLVFVEVRVTVQLFELSRSLHKSSNSTDGLFDDFSYYLSCAMQ